MYVKKKYGYDKAPSISLGQIQTRPGELERGEGNSDKAGNLKKKVGKTVVKPSGRVGPIRVPCKILDVGHAAPSSILAWSFCFSYSF